MRTFYLRDENRFPVACVVSEIVGEQVGFAISIWNPKDEFNKQRGRDVAEGRANKGKFIHSVALAEGQFKRKIIEHLATSNYPGQVSKAAKLWLKTHKA